ncbi:MAG: hypothetical protein M1828_003978 [Chrysothrix sp. TS-e1954]|nr:MAG: hypothetical protein M1828_003978 [Chrysothrix sp. TS-e1954]
MDIAYDQIQEEALSPHESSTPHPFRDEPSKAEDSSSSNASNTTSTQRPLSTDLNTELKKAYQTFAGSAWGAKLGGLWGTVRKQGETYYSNAASELSNASREASKSSTSTSADGVTHTPTIAPSTGPTTDIPTSTTSSTQPQPTTITTATSPSTTPTQPQQQPASLPADIALEASSMFSALRLTASSRLKQLQKAEDAADEALLHFGSNVRDFFKDAVTITPPTDGDGKRGDVLFESTAPGGVGGGGGARTIHATRTEAHLHVLHTNPASFTSPQSTASNPAYPAWQTASGFDVEAKTDDIAKDLSRYPELRGMMETLVPSQIAYAEFWSRYYFLRHVIEEEEKRRKELLANSLEQEEIGWDDDEEEAAVEGKGTPKQRKAGEGTLKPMEPRRSHEGQSVADSDASYDIVSQGVASRGPDSPKEEDKEGKKQVERREKEESDEEDWE